MSPRSSLTSGPQVSLYTDFESKLRLRSLRRSTTDSETTTAPAAPGDAGSAGSAAAGPLHSRSFFGIGIGM